MKVFRILVFILLNILCFPANLVPENLFAGISSPMIKNDSDSLVLTVDSSDEDMIFVSPQNIDLKIGIKSVSNQKRDVTLICKITTDDYNSVDSLSYKIKYKNKEMSFDGIKYTPLHPGFYRFTVYAEGKGIKSNVLRFNVGFNPESIISPADAPADFEIFWQKTKEELGRVVFMGKCKDRRLLLCP